MMPKKRLISSSVMSSDRFKLGLEFSQQALYTQLVLAADDEGFVESPRGICLSMKARDEDLAKLAQAGFVTLFDSGVLAITDWHRMDATSPSKRVATEYEDERASLDVVGGRYIMRAAGSYLPASPQVNELPGNCPEVARKMSGQSPENSREMSGQSPENSRRNAAQTNTNQTNTNQTNPIRAARSRASRPESLDEVRAYVSAKGYGFDPEQFWAHYEANGWRTNQGVVRDWHACCVTWQKRLEEGFPALRRGQPRAVSAPPVPSGMEAYNHGASV